ncbi:MAG: hypothetical protein ACRBB0_09080 [Pelagimonas sp.]|uniref:hypothetical protein n=1 Tax=Pelagimonas sp. TaxID=2073170 RepID=UPI003D6A85BE
MKLHFSPMRRDDPLVLERQGDIVIINGEPFDFTDLPEGQTLPAQAVASDWITGPISRQDGVLELSIGLPHGPNASAEQRAAQSIEVTQDGLVALPGCPDQEI